MVTMKMDGISNPARRSRNTARTRILVGACAAVALVSRSLAADFPPLPQQDQRPTLIVRLSRLNAAYADLKYLLDLVGDSRGYRDFQETLDLALDGIATDRPCEITVLPSPDGLQAVGYLPAATNDDFRKFLQALADADVRTSATIPSARRSKLPSVRLQPNERIIVSLYEGFLRFDESYVRLGRDLESVRRPRRIEPAGERDATVTIHVDGSSATPEARRAAFGASRERLLEKMEKGEQQTQPEFAFQKSLMDGLLSAMELAFAESSQFSVDWSLSHESRQSRLDWRLTPGQSTSLAGDLQRVQGLSDPFASVSGEGTALSASWTIPINAALTRPLKAVIASARELERARIQQTLDLSDVEKSADCGLIDVLFDVADDVTGGPDCNGFLRSWSNGNQTLTTVAALRISDAARYRDRVRALKSQEVGRLKADNDALAVNKIITSKWPRDQKECFDREGAVVIGVGKEAIWLGIGDNALQRLEQSAAEVGAGAKVSGMAMSLSSHMLPLSEVWNQLHSRRITRPKPRSRPKSETKNRGTGLIEEKPSLSLLREISADLDLPAIAAHAYQQGSDAIEVKLTQDGGQVALSARFEEGTLRFVGQALSRFAKDNF